MIGTSTYSIRYISAAAHCRLVTIVFLCICLAFVGCSGYQKLVKSDDFNKKYEAAIDYYKKGDNNRALQLFDMILPFYRGTEKAEQIYFYTAKCYFDQGDYIMASYYFKVFAKNYPNSKNAEEALYMNAFCKYLDSPDYSLDQTNTYDAIQEIQLFLNTFPNSERLAKCNELMDELRRKLERKDYEIAKLYYKMKDYQAAITGFKNLYKDYPDTHYKEEVLFLTVKAYYDYAINSIISKKKERFNGAMDAYKTFVTFYPSSTYINDAEQIKSKIQSELSNLPQNNIN